MSTLNTYNLQAASIAKKHHLVAPTRIYELIHAFFHKSAPTADIGCGSGRDTEYLHSLGFEIEGFDGSEGMLSEAKHRYKELSFTHATLPELSTIQDSRYKNILCSAVLMHLSDESLITAAINLLRITLPTGRLILSFRNTLSKNFYEDGKLYHPINPHRLGLLFQTLGAKLLFQESTPDSTRDGIFWHTLVIEKEDLTCKDGIYKLQEIITRDKKTSTYKLALIRALCHMAKYEPHLIHWELETKSVWVPLKRLGSCWIKFYWPLILHNIKQTTNTKLAFDPELRALPYALSDFAVLGSDLESPIPSKELTHALKKIVSTMIKGPIHYSGGESNPVFSSFTPKYPDFDLFSHQYPGESELGMMRVPHDIWKDLINFNHWIEDSLVIEWARETERIDKTKRLSTYLDLLLTSFESTRDTSEIRKLYHGQSVECVWSGTTIQKFEVDHVIPYSVWKNNDLWNLLPCLPKINKEKLHRLPTLDLITKRQDCILSYWENYQRVWPERFNFQMKKALGVKDPVNFHRPAILGLMETLERLSLMQGLERYDH